MSLERKELGRKGEEIALKFLEGKGFSLLQKNLRLKIGEIDLLMLDKETLVVVEVKTKTSSRYSLPQERVDRHKQAKLVSLAKAVWKNFPKRKIRIDVVAVDESRNFVDHIINAVEDF